MSKHATEIPYQDQWAHVFVYRLARSIASSGTDLDNTVKQCRRATNASAVRTRLCFRWRFVRDSRIMRIPRFSYGECSGGSRRARHRAPEKLSVDADRLHVCHLSVFAAGSMGVNRYGRLERTNA